MKEETPYSLEDLRKLSIDGMAEKYGVSATSVRNWRKKHGLGSTTIASAIRQHIELLGVQSDEEVAELAGVDVKSVTKFRRKHRIRSTTPKLAMAAADIATLPPSEVASRWNVSRSAVTYRRKSAGLPVLRRNLEEWEIDAIERNAGDAPDGEIAAALERAIGTVANVRKRAGLDSYQTQRRESREQRIQSLRERLR